MLRLRILVLVALLAPAAARADTFNIEIDYMVDTDHTHQPTTAELNAVIQMFACEGHTLNIDLDDALPHVDVLVRNPSNCNSSLFGYDNNSNSSFGQIRQTYFDHDGQAGWYYGVFAHRYEDTSCNTSGSSGLSNGGLFFIVTMGGFSGQVGTPFDKAATLAHEFGHNLGLSHCGSQVCGSNTGDPDYVGPYVPNMPSVMSYRYQLAGVKTNLLCNGLAFEEALFKDIDYSHGRLCGINENNLDERVGAGMIYTDWDCDGSIESSVVKDVNGTNGGWCGANGNRTNNYDYNEWANLSPGAALVSASKSRDATIAAEAQLELARREKAFDEHPCITAEEWQEVQIAMDLRGGCAQPALTTESCFGGENIFVGTEVCLPFVGCLHFGICNFPYVGLAEAQNAAPSNSVYYLEPKTYDEAGVLTLNKRGKYFCERSDNGGTALIR